MSTVLSYSASNFTILMTDTYSFRLDGNQKRVLNDSTLKIHYCAPFGFITGIGLGDLAQRTFIGLSKCKGFSEFSLHDAYKAAYFSIRKEKECTAEILELLDHTSVVVSDHASIITFSPEFLKHFNTEAVVVNKNFLCINFPFDISDEDKEKIQQQGNGLKSNSIHVCLKEMLKIFKTISFLSGDVSDICSIAMMGSNIETPFFLQQKVDNIIEQMDSGPFDAIQNEFDRYKDQLISWDTI